MRVALAATASRGMATATPGSALGDKSAPTPRPVEDSDLLGLVRTGLHPLSLADLVKYASGPLRSPPSRPYSIVQF